MESEGFYFLLLLYIGHTQYDQQKRSAEQTAAMFLL